ncbi:hypothetical protein ACHAWC_001429 [Mediolabrus comicus]
MKISQISTALLLIQGVAAFAPSRTIIQSPHQAVRSTSLGSAMQAVPSLPNPYKNLPWNVDREEARKQRRLTTENAALFRELGLPEDATYEDVAAKTKHLIELTEELPRNEGIKKKIKIEIARDKIYQIRLNERIAGVRTEQEDAARVQKWEEEGVDGVISMTDNIDDIVKPKKKLRIPIVSGLVEYIQSVIKKPDEEWGKRNLVVWGGSTLLCLVLPSMTEGFARLNWLPAGGMMGYRGMPGNEERGNGYNPFRGKRNKKHQVQAMGIGIFCWLVARSIAEWAVTSVPAMAASRSAEWFKFAIVQAALGGAVSYVQTYKEGEDSPELMI